MRLASVRLASGRFPKRTASITLLGLVPWGETNGEDTVYHSPHSLITVRAIPQQQLCVVGPDKDAESFQPSATLSTL
jgi:hypothetical protein